MRRIIFIIQTGRRSSLRFPLQSRSSLPGAPAAVASQLQDLIQVPKGQQVDKNLILVPFKGKTNDVSGVLARLKADPAVEAALPVFDAPGRIW